jgi:hemerythrin superfamily protein
MSDTKVMSRKATALLQEDHRRVKELFEEYEELGEGAAAEKRRLFERIERLIGIHAQIEEEIFYPAVAQAESEDAPELVREAEEEHRIVKSLIEELTVLSPDQEEFDAKMDVLCENVEQHAEDEEKEIFPLFRGLDRDRQEEVSERLRARKLELEREEGVDEE